MSLDLVVLSLGGGRQSGPLYGMLAEGELGPLPDVAVFADTQHEPPWVYDQIDLCERLWGDRIPLRRVSRGSLAIEAFRSAITTPSAFVPIPLRGTTGALGRKQCTYQQKIRPIERAARAELGVGRREKIGSRLVGMVLGIPWEEAAERANPSRTPWVRNLYPLVEARLTSSDCAAWLRARSLPEFRKSSCVFCPYKGDAQWRELRDELPATFRSVSLLEGILSEVTGRPQLVHRSGLPLDTVDLDTADAQLDLFREECEGHCGL